MKIINKKISLTSISPPVETYLKIMEDNDHGILANKIRKMETFMGTNPINVFRHHFNSIVECIKNKKHQEFFIRNKEAFIRSFMTKEEIEINHSDKTNIPKYNYIHVAQSCFFDSTLSMISSLNTVVIKLYQSYGKGDIVNDALCNSLLESIRGQNNQKGRPRIDLANALNINLSVQDRPDDVIKTLLKTIYKYCSKRDIYYWDTSNDFIEEDEKDYDINKLVAKYKPLYFLCSIGDFNTVMEYESDMLKVREFDVVESVKEDTSPTTETRVHDTQKKCHYKLQSAIAFSFNHYFTLFAVPNGYIVRDDMGPVDGNNHIYSTLTDYNCIRKSQNSIGKDYHHFIACYIKE